MKGLVNENSVGKAFSSAMEASDNSLSSRARWMITPRGLAGHARRTMKGRENVYSSPLMQITFPKLRRKTNTAWQIFGIRSCFDLDSLALKKGLNVSRSVRSSVVSFFAPEVLEVAPVPVSLALREEIFPKQAYCTGSPSFEKDHILCCTPPMLQMTV
jgi:hypothetical protein